MTELIDLARSIAGRADGGEQIEAYAARGRETSVRIFEADIE